MFNFTVILRLYAGKCKSNFVMIKWVGRIIDWCFPLYCAGCQLEGVVCCQSCWAALVFKLSQECPYCRRESLEGQTCGDCQGRGNLDGLIILFDYQKNGLLAKLLHYYKYDQIPEYGQVLKKILVQANTVWKSWFERKIEMITWVPMTRRKQSARGFNQSEMLAGWLGLDGVVGVLEKGRESRAQMELNRKERLINLKNAFRVKSSALESVQGKSIVIIDDIATTLSTLEELACRLKEAGAKEVYGFTLARQKS